MNNKISIKIYYDDTDAGGVVYYANYLKYLERSRTEFFQGYNINVAEYHEKGCMFVVAHVDISYKQSARLGDIIDITSEIAELKNASLIIKHRIFKGDKLLIEAQVKLACVNKEGRVQKFPDEFKKLLLNET
ncbi:MAG: acyl-CoA thioesterase [Nitrospiraceae bacterium]|nr:acyl-CoA thioesterase [Nitrospiraceae bacterium]